MNSPLSLFGIERPEDIATLKRLYDEAVSAREEVFTFQGHDVLTSYAKYLIAHLEGLRATWNESTGRYEARHD